MRTEVDHNITFISLAASGDETSDPQSSQAQSPAKDVPELDILDEDAMLAVFRERALLSMQGRPLSQLQKGRHFFFAEIIDEYYG